RRAPRRSQFGCRLRQEVFRYSQARSRYLDSAHLRVSRVVPDPELCTCLISFNAQPQAPATSEARVAGAYGWALNREEFPRTLATRGYSEFPPRKRLESTRAQVPIRGGELLFVGPRLLLIHRGVRNCFT